MRFLSRALAAIVAIALSACSGGHTSSPLPSTPQTQTPIVPPQSIASGPIAYGKEALQGAALAGPAKLANVDFGVLMNMRDPAGLARYAQDANDPHSGQYHHFLTPDQIADRFGAAQADYQAVRSYFASKGLATMGWRQRELLRVAGPQAAVEAALGANFGAYTKNGRQFHSLMSAPQAIAKLPIAALVGTADYAQIVSAPVRLATTPTARSGYSPQQLAAAFDYNGAYAAGYTGAGVNLGIIGTGPIMPQDLAAYKSIYHLAGSSTVTQVNVSDFGGNIPNGPAAGFPTLTFAPPPLATDTCTINPNVGITAACNPEDFEAQLDTQQTAALARDANVLFYLAFAPNVLGSGFNLQGISLTQYEIQQAISDNKADILSLSFGVGERDDVGVDFVLGADGNYDPAKSIGPIQFATLATMGVAVFVASGDSGALECSRDQAPMLPNVDSLCVSYPATDPNVVAIGGVNAPLAPDGHFVGPITGWGAQTGGFAVNSASGGGIAQYFPLPAYQAGAAGVSGSKRNTPDISLDGDGFTGVATVVNAAFPDALIARFGGTSVAAPETAAMWALVLQACRVNAATCTAHPGTGGVSYRLGNPNPILYALYANAAQYKATFTDVLFGDNSQLPGCTNPVITGVPSPCPVASPTPIAGYQAGVGYDRITGIGVPAGRALIKAIVGI